MRLLGIDHGPGRTGWGFVELDDAGEVTKTAAGLIELPPLDDGGLNRLHSAIEDLLGGELEDLPDVVLMEQQNSFRNATTTRQMLWSQGVCLMVTDSWGIAVEFVHRATVQKVVGGAGGATKAQVMRGVKARLGVDRKISEDEADALALCVTYPTWSAEKPKREAARNARRAAAARKRHEERQR